MEYCNNGRGKRIPTKYEDDVDKNGDPMVYWINQDLCWADQEAQFFVRKRLEERRKEKKKQQSGEQVVQAEVSPST